MSSSEFAPFFSFLFFRFLLIILYIKSIFLFFFIFVIKSKIYDERIKNMLSILKVISKSILGKSIPSVFLIITIK